MTTQRSVEGDRRAFLRLAGGALGVLALAARPSADGTQPPGAPLKIGMVGSGRQGSALGLRKSGHT